MFRLDTIQYLSLFPNFSLKKKEKFHDAISVFDVYCYY